MRRATHLGNVWWTDSSENVLENESENTGTSETEAQPGREVFSSSVLEGTRIPWGQGRTGTFPFSSTEHPLQDGDDG